MLIGKTKSEMFLSPKGHKKNHKLTENTEEDRLENSWRQSHDIYFHENPRHSIFKINANKSVTTTIALTSLRFKKLILTLLRWLSSYIWPCFYTCCYSGYVSLWILCYFCTCSQSPNCTTNMEEYLECPWILPFFISHFFQELLLLLLSLLLDKYINQDLGQALSQRYCDYILINSVQVSSDSYIAITWWDPQEKNNYFQNVLKYNQ